MNKIIMFILIILLIFICVSIDFEENFKTNKYKIILINHKNYKIIIIKDINNADNKIYKIYKN